MPSSPHSISGYAAAFSAIFAASFDADAAIIYSGIQNLNISVGDATSTSSSTSIDFLALGVDPIVFLVSVSNASATQLANADVSPGAHNDIFLPNLPGGGNRLQMTLGETIDAMEDLGIWSGGVQEFANQFISSAAPSGVRSGDWSNAETGFIGFRLSLDGANFNYAWARVTLNQLDASLSQNNISDLTVVDWAYEELTGVGITAGAVPEPSSLALLALGALGVSAVRRRKKTA